jgi:hypothetical protein
MFCEAMIVIRYISLVFSLALMLGSLDVISAQISELAAGQGLPLIVEDIQGTRHCVYYSNSWTKKTLKEAIAVELNLSDKKFWLIFEGEELAALGRLRDYDHVKISYQKPLMRIYIKTLYGEEIPFCVSSDTVTIGELKSQICKQEGTPVIQIRLIYQAKQLEDDRSVKHYGIRKGDTIQMVLRMAGD